MMDDVTRWVARLTPAAGHSIDELLRFPLSLDVWERRPGSLVVAASESQLAEIERRRLATVERIETVAEFLARQEPPSEP
jgi:hypothetical protein